MSQLGGGRGREGFHAVPINTIEIIIRVLQELVYSREYGMTNFLESMVLCGGYGNTLI